MAIWLFKTEPGDYSYGDLERDRKTVWDGVGNTWALKNLREVRAGDRALIYHTGKDKAVMGEAKIVSDPYPDPELEDPKMAVVDVAPVRAWSRPVKLAEIKADPAFEDFTLVRFSRLSIMPVETQIFRRLEKMSH